MKKLVITLAAVVLASGMTFAKVRPNDQRGVNQFETVGADSVDLEGGIKTVFGGNLSLPYQMLNQSNTYSPLVYNYTTPGANTLVPLASNFGLPMANLNMTTFLADGVTLNFTLYLASRHHNETWVKGGFLQFDKLPFLKCDLVDKVMEFTSLKVGQMDLNYGDAHFRRSDGGNAIYNPFVENYIMDEFATEIGAEADFHYNGFIGVLGMTNGELSPDLVKLDTTQASMKYSNGAHNPSFLGKIGYDGQLTDQLRVRLTGSAYYTAGAIKNTLFGGDRTGSNYSNIMYNSVSTGNAFGGRYNPNLTDKLFTVMGNLFLKYKPLEWLSVESFSTYEQAKGRTMTELTERNATQIASDLVFRFGKDENFFLGARYNTVKAEQYLAADLPAVPAVAAAGKNGALPAFDKVTKGVYNVDVNRIAISGGWFMTKNIMAKVEYVTQNYGGFLYNDIRNGGKFDGLTAQAIIGF